MANFTLRPATEADFSNIRRLIREMRLNPTGLNWKCFIIAETSSGVFAGCGQIKPHAQGFLELASIAVEESFHDQGVASQVIRHLLANEPQRPIYLTCRSELRSFYEKFSFRVLQPDEMPAYYRNLSSLVNFFLFFSKSRMLVMGLEHLSPEKSV